MLDDLKTRNTPFILSHSNGAGLLMLKKFFLLTIAICITFLIASCGLYKGKFDQENGRFNGPNDFVLQLDDDGRFLDSSVAAKALQRISEESNRTNTIVLLFIHGWHHNAKFDDPNAMDFADSLADTRQLLDDNTGGKPGIYRKSRQLLTTDPDVNVISIYVGWRGRSLPTVFDYLTFWSRKPAAERVGSGDLKQFLMNLNAIYVDRNLVKDGATQQKRFMGLVSFGHSFGGQVLFKAVADTLEKNLEIAAAGKSATGRAQKPVQGFGDLTVLINPAFEANQFQHLHELSQKLSFGVDQAPLLLVLSSQTDKARQFFFPKAQIIAGWFRSDLENVDRQLWRTALGEYEPQRTHSLHIGPGGTGLNPALYSDKACSTFDLDLTNLPAFGNVDLVPLGNVPIAPFRPYVVAYADSDIVIGHNGIFKGPLRMFLSDYVAISEGRRMLRASPLIRSLCEIAKLQPGA